MFDKPTEHNNTITLKRIENLGYAKIPYANLKEAVDAALPDERSAAV